MQQDNKKILIIEDEFPMRYLIEYQLKHNGYVVNLAKDGPDGLKAIQQDRPDLVLLDVMMPGMDGFEVCLHIKNNPETADIPVIFVTASEVYDYRTRAFDVGAAEYMTKPFRPEDLVEQIKAVIHRSGATYEGVYSETAVSQQKTNGQTISLFSPKGGVGVTTLAVQFAEAITVHAERPVVLIDLHLPLGGLAPMLRLFPRHDITELLKVPKSYVTMEIVDQFAMRYRDNIYLIPAPGRLLDPQLNLNMETFRHVLDLLTKGGYEVVVDVGSQLSKYAIEALAASQLTFIVTSGQAVSNQQVDAVLQAADHFGLDARRLMPVINEVAGPVREVTLSRVPVARLPFSGQPSDTKLWLKEQGLRKMVTLLY
jgi:pilus assembly protein CpaE